MNKLLDSEQLENSEKVYSAQKKFTFAKFEWTDDNLPMHWYFLFSFNLGAFKGFGEYSLEEQEIMQGLRLAQEVDT